MSSDNHLTVDAAYPVGREGLLEVWQDFANAVESGRRLYHELLIYDSSMLNLGVVKSQNPATAWPSFIDAHQGKLLESPTQWEDWDTFPNNGACSRFVGEGEKSTLREFKALASRAFTILHRLKKDLDDGCQAPQDVRLAIPSCELEGSPLWDGKDCGQSTISLDPQDEHYGWLQLLYETGRSCPTSILGAEKIGSWGGLDYQTPLHPSFFRLKDDLFRSSAEMLQLWLDPSTTVLPGEEQTEPPIYLPSIEGSPRRGPKPYWDSEYRELWFLGQLVKYISKFPETTNQERILAAFQEDEWPHGIDNPIPSKGDMNPKRRLADTIADLNKGHITRKLIHFRGDGTGEGVIWEPVRSRRKSQTSP